VLLSRLLEKYASYNCIFELGALSAFTVNNPQETYRLSGADVTILRSGGGIDERRVQTAYDALGKEPGNLEYFIDDVNIRAIVSPSRRSGLSQATKIEFTVNEPYSMGLFLQAMQAAALQANFANYLEAPYMLELDFIGWDDEGNAVPVENANKKIPLKLANIEFDVERGGSVYKVSAYPWNEMALLDNYQVIADDISISGPSVFEILTSGEQSLTTIINRAILTAAQAKEEPGSDTYLIRFPSSRTGLNNTQTETAGDTGATSAGDPLSVTAQLGENVGEYAAESLAGGLFSNTGNSVVETIRSDTLNDLNQIGAAFMLDPDPMKIRSNGDHPFGLGLYTWEENEDGVGVYRRDGVELSITGDQRTFKFKQGTKISKIIEEIVLASDYGRAAIQSVNEEGMTPWFRIEPQVFVLDNPAHEQIAGRKPLIWVYNVVPYEVHISTFSAPNQDIGTKERQKQAVKEYNYIYSGQNQDVLGFDIKFNAAFFTAINTDFGERSAGERSATSEGITATSPEAGIQRGSDTISDEPQGSTEVVPSATGVASGNYNIDRLQNIARTFHEALLNSDVDLITADLEIWGDPYYLTDSGMGNYNAERSGASVMVNADGSADYQQGNVHIGINFRTPIDYNQDGTMEFPEDTQAVKGFSGLYRVLSVDSNFSNNRFTQTLGLLRERNQSLEGAVEQQQAQATRQTDVATNTNDENNSTPPETTGQAVNDRTTATTVAPAAEPLNDNGDLAEIVSKNGVRVQVAALYADRFQGFIDELENDYGYEIRTLSGERRTRVSTSGRWSYHASGLAIDINGSENRWIVPRSPTAPEPTDMPQNGTGSAMPALAAKYGLGWGGAWNSSTDSMHFSLAVSEGGTVEWEPNGLIPGAPQPREPVATGEPQELPTAGPDDGSRSSAPSGSQDPNRRAFIQGEIDKLNASIAQGRTSLADAEELANTSTNPTIVSQANSVAASLRETIQNKERALARANADLNSLDQSQVGLDAFGGTGTPVSSTSPVSNTPVSGTSPVSDTPVATPNPASNPQGNVSGLRPYYGLNIEDDRYDFNTGDKIKAILAAYRNINNG